MPNIRNHPALRLLRNACRCRHRLPWKSQAVLQKYDIVNGLIGKNGYQTYLEICTAETGGQFYSITRRGLRIRHRLMYLCPQDFEDGEEITFRSCSEAIDSVLSKLLKYDVVFVDPWHTLECSRRDLETGLSVLREGGVMIVHDCYPSREFTAPQRSEGCWSGLTYCAFVDFLLAHPELAYCTVDTDFGCGVVKKIRPGETWPAKHIPTAQLIERWQSGRAGQNDMYDFFFAHKRELLNLVTAAEFLSQEGITAPLPVRFSRALSKLRTRSSAPDKRSYQEPHFRTD